MASMRGDPHLLRAIRRLADHVLGDMAREFDGLYARVGLPLDSTGSLAARAAAADLLFDSQRAAVEEQLGQTTPAALFVTSSDRTRRMRRKRCGRRLSVFQQAARARPRSGTAISRALPRAPRHLDVASALPHPCAPDGSISVIAPTDS
jgi:hypothetical protein